MALAARGGTHACGDFSAARFLAGKGPLARALFEGFRALLEAAGPVELAPARTRVAFLTQVRFASVNRASARGLDVHFVLPRRVDSPRLRKVEAVGPLFVHHLRLTSASDLDRQLDRWLRAARREYGDRTWLRRGRGR